MKQIIVAVLAFCLSACAQQFPGLDKSTSQWQARLDAELPPGASADQIRAWGHQNHVDFMYLADQHQFYANVESIPAKGFGFPCGSWNIIIHITLGSSGWSAVNQVSQVGSCV